ncbi:hypothetical protein [Jannaschia aquimarina]|uniref:Uncharacterized protein n=1 Tax=Jannaschia aquimarina TaxID=935700 RepID=A0A0D1EFI1_9RHOB|nr:hypothetical protein [Jannaschia aquimarina]KIT16399.1 hypothetical protein jaqu_18840 [Jannaschia aquimarina]SNT05666.1 hypothetical protein SAMN05421775_10556 [Jannaschia aquimarina]
MTFTSRNAAAAAAIGAALVYVIGLALVGWPQPLAFHAALLGLGAVVGVADLFLFSMIARIRGR